MSDPRPEQRSVLEAMLRMEAASLEFISKVEMLTWVDRRYLAIARNNLEIAWSMAQRGIDVHLKLVDLAPIVAPDTDPANDDTMEVPS